MDDEAQRYISAAIDLAAEREDELSDDELTEIAAELGLTPEDLARVDQVIEDHVTRGRGYVSHAMWDDAIEELEEAITLAPRRTDALHQLAAAYLGRAEATGFADDRERARQLARKCLELDPEYDAAFDLLGQLDGTAASHEVTPTIGIGLLAGAVIAVLLTVVLGYLAISTTGPVPDPPPPPSPVTHETPEQPVETGERELDVEFVENPRSEGLAFEPLRARLAVYPENAFFRLWGDLEVTGALEVERVNLSLSLLDADGEAVTTDSWEAWAGHEATLRRGDHGFFEHLTRADGRAESARLEVTLVEKTPSGGEYEKARPVDVQWRIDRPEHVDIVFAERAHRFSSNDLFDGGFVHATWEVQNAGTAPIRTLKYEVRLLDAGGEPLEVKTRLATFSSHPPIRPGDVFLESLVTQVPETYDHYELSVVELQ